MGDTREDDCAVQWTNPTHLERAYPVDPDRFTNLLAFKGPAQFPG